MSHQAKIDYNHIACQCNTICELAEKRLVELDDMLIKVAESSSRLLNSQTEALSMSIKKEKERLLENIKEVKDKANKDAKMGTVSTSEYNERYIHRNDTIEAAKKLENIVNEVASKKIIEFKSLLDNLLKESLNDGYRMMIEKGKGNVIISEKVQDLLDSIDDLALRQFTLLAFIKNNSLFGESLKNAGKELMNNSLNKTYEDRINEEEERIRAELEAAKVDKNLIEKVVSNKFSKASDRLIQMQAEATNEVIGEKVRQQSIKVIMKAIQDRGFIVDKKNIKINRETNEVNMIAVKASGERAEFKVYMDGKFIYDFHHGYQGQGCQKDIEPFMKDLEEVYGIHVTKSQEIWSNPDKISTMKYQSINTNKNKG